MPDQFKALFLISSGASGTLIAAIKTWQEHIEWSLRIVLLVVSIASVIVGLVIASRKKAKPRD